ncbi:hypothetical protein POVCU2_0040540 [Plasmodium ovale curtisi]|uniref:Uncharacterized protein n=1 Tax=Plasmodium ovale curtisi TaxID=864141 RepID=A0A1A8W297_PLAOA|nr:hypothetical protein POVCU2_0040540 [Plasmodium ovale curtisi]
MVIKKKKKKRGVYGDGSQCGEDGSDRNERTFMGTKWKHYFNIKKDDEKDKVLSACIEREDDERILCRPLYLKIVNFSRYGQAKKEGKNEERAECPLGEQHLTHKEGATKNCHLANFYSNKFDAPIMTFSPVAIYQEPHVHEQAKHLRIGKKAFSRL